MSGVDKKQSNELRRVLQQMPKHLTEGIRRSVKEGAGDLEAAMEDGYGRHRRTGLLEETVGVSFISNGFTAKIGFPGKRRMKKAFYSFWLEFGTRNAPAERIQLSALNRTAKGIGDKIEREVDKALRTFTRG